MTIRIPSRLNKRFRQTIDEAERLLTGRLLDSPDFSSNPVSAWSIVGTLGHASLADLKRLEAAVGRRDPNPWRRVVAFLASETLGSAADEDALIRLQRNVLVPLELRLLGGEVPSPTTALGIVTLVRRALNSPLRPDA
jgi:hypothetical protein